MGTVQKAATFSLYWQSSRSLLNFSKYHALPMLFSQKADRYPASILCIPSICMRTLSLTGCDVLTYNDWEDNFFFLSIWLCPSPPVVISAEGGLLSPTMLSLSVSLSPHAHLIPAHWKKCVCVCVCLRIHAAPLLPLPSSLRLFSFFTRVAFFSPKYLSPHPPLLPLSPFSLPLSTSPQKKEKKKKPIPLVAMGSGCHAAARFSHGPRVCVCVSTVAWRSLDVMLMGKRGRGVELGCEVSKLAAAI